MNIFKLAAKAIKIVKKVKPIAEVVAPLVKKALKKKDRE